MDGSPLLQNAGQRPPLDLNPASFHTGYLVLECSCIIRTKNHRVNSPKLPKYYVQCTNFCVFLYSVAKGIRRKNMDVPNTKTALNHENNRRISGNNCPIMSKFVQKQLQTPPAKQCRASGLIVRDGRTNFVQIYKYHTRKHAKTTSKQCEFRNNWYKKGHNHCSLLYSYSKLRITIHFLQFLSDSYIMSNCNICRFDFL